jgi:hypothetical protein
VSGTVVLKVNRIIWLAVVLIAIGVGSLIFQLLAIGKLQDISADTRIVKSNVIPLCLTPGALGACADQIAAAERPAVIRLCIVVHDRLQLKPEICAKQIRNEHRDPGDATQGSGARGSGNSELQSNASGGVSGVSGGGDTDATSPGGGTDPGGPDGGSTDPPTTEPPTTEPPITEPPPTTEPPDVTTGIGVQAGACAVGACAGIGANVSGSGIGANVGLGNGHLGVNLPRHP